MSWLAYNGYYRAFAVNTPVFRTVYIKATTKGMELEPLLKLMVNPTAVLGLGGFFTKATDFISSLMYVPINQNNIRMSSPFSLYVYDGVASPANTNLTVSVPSLDLPELYNLGSYWVQAEEDFTDYNGYTKIDVYLPYLGFVSVNPNEVVGKFIQIRMAFNTVSGEATYYIGVNDENVGYDYANDAFISAEADKNTRILSVHTCQLGTEIPVGSTNAGEIQRNILLGAVKVAGKALSYANAANSGAFVTKKSFNIVDTVQKRNAKTKKLAVSNKESIEGTVEIDRSAKASFDVKNDCFKSAISTLNNLHLDVASDRPNSSFNLADLDTNVHIVTYRPKIRTVDSEYRKLYGVPLGKVKKLINVSGYTEISAVHIGGSGFDTATSEELIMIEEQLSQGVIL